MEFNKFCFLSFVLDFFVFLYFPVYLGDKTNPFSSVFFNNQKSSKHLNPRFLTTYVHNKYLEVLFENPAHTNLNIPSNPLCAKIWCILPKQGSQGP